MFIACGKLVLCVVKVIDKDKGTHISQLKYALNMFNETVMVETKPVDTPVEHNVGLVSGQREPLIDPRKYIGFVGKLHYLTVTKRDSLLFIVCN